MITGDLKSKIDRMWDAFWSGGISNPLEVIEQITYLMFIRRLDGIQIRKERLAGHTGKAIESPVYAADKEHLRWSRFVNQAPEAMHALEQTYGQRPVIFYTNGYQTHLWDDLNYPPRQVHGFYTKEELRLLIQRRAGRLALAGVAINAEIAARHYQTRAIRRIGETFERDKQRQALLVMATGAGKTRTVIALVDQLTRANWVKRVLFLADRKALVRQAANAFKQLLPGVPTVNMLTDKEPNGRVLVCTYPTMMGLINETDGDLRRFGPGYFDLIVVDEAHRSIYQKYGAIFEYFDGLLVGLTATPKEEVDRNTYRRFNPEDGVPTDDYGLDEAVAEGYLVPARTVDVPLKFQREGIRYAELSEEEKEEWEAAEWDKDGTIPQEVTSEELNRFLFNADTVDKALATLMTYGLKVAGGDRLGKTIIFAKNQAHANFIAARFDSFSIRDKAPHIAVSVDMLDTGIDVPEVWRLAVSTSRRLPRWLPGVPRIFSRRATSTPSSRCFARYGRQPCPRRRPCSGVAGPL